VRCGDRSCSLDGSCPLHSTQKEVMENDPPDLQLLPVPAANSRGVVKVPRGWLYEFCEPEMIGTLSEPCEPGAILCACVR
jgi:hypothetical protein